MEQYIDFHIRQRGTNYLFVEWKDENGKRQRKALGQTGMKDAKVRAREIVYGRKVIGPKTHGVTMRELFERCQLSIWSPEEYRSQPTIKSNIKILNRCMGDESITTDGLRSYRAAMKEIGNANKQEIGRWANNRVENSHQPFRRRERAMLRFRQMKSLQKFSSVHAAFHNHFNKDRHLTNRDSFKAQRSGRVEVAYSLSPKPDRLAAVC